MWQIYKRNPKAKQICLGIYDLFYFVLSEMKQDMPVPDTFGLQMHSGTETNLEGIGLHIVIIFVVGPARVI